MTSVTQSDRMMITIFSGLSGSKEIQQVMYQLYGSHLDMRVIINGYSDEQLRHMYEDQILGPSNLCKNHIIRHQLIHGVTPISLFLETSMHESSMQNVLDLMTTYIHTPEYEVIFRQCISDFFSHTFILPDFNVGNMIYASLIHNQGVMEAIRVMESILQIPKDSVLFHSTKPLFWSAMTRKGKCLTDVESLTDHDDEIESLHLHDASGKIESPFQLDPRVIEIMCQTDLMIFLPGNHLVPTYLHKDFQVLMNSLQCIKLH